MPIKEILSSINLELEIIKEAQERIKSHAAELNKLNPLKIGQELVVTGYSHAGKTIVVDKVFVSDQQCNNVEITANEPLHFTAFGRVKKLNNELGVHSGEHKVSLEGLIS